VADIKKKAKKLVKYLQNLENIVYLLFLDYSAFFFLKSLALDGFIIFFSLDFVGIFS